MRAAACSSARAWPGASSGLTVLGTAILGPGLPAMQAHFKDVPGAEFLVPLTMTVPMLMMAGLSVFEGKLADRIGASASSSPRPCSTRWWGRHRCTCRR